MIENFIKQEENQLKDIFRRFRKRDFSGNTGQALKNSAFQLATSLIMKFGALFFTVILARLLMPELFGLYSLALSTIIMFSAFSDLGVGSALITFVSKSLGKGEQKKAKAYFIQLFKWKLWLTFLATVILLASAYFVSNIYYVKPIFLALLAGAIYLPITTLTSFLTPLFQASNLFRYNFYKEVLFQVLRFIIVPSGILIILKTSLNNSIVLLIIFLLLSFCYMLVFFYLLYASKKRLAFLSVKKSYLTKKKRKELILFLIPLIALGFSGIFFGSIDTFMLGHFVAEEFIAFYGAAFALIGAATTIVSFTGIALLPIFSRLKGRVLEGSFRKTRATTAIIGIFGVIFTFFCSKYIILIVYGSEYLPAVLVLKFFSVLMFLIPLATLYNNYFISQGKTKAISILLVSTTILNIILNYFFIKQGLQFGMYEAVLGATLATIISRTIYLGCLGLTKKLSKEKTKSKSIFC